MLNKDSPDYKQQPLNESLLEIDFGPLEELYAYVGAQCDEMRRRHPWWPCNKGCSDCCYFSTFLVSEYEFAYMRRGIALLPKNRREKIVLRAKEIAQQHIVPYAPVTHWAPVVQALQYRRIRCPLLFGGACSVYPYRPTVCRLYGFFVTPAAEEGICYWCPKVAEATLAQPAQARARQAPNLTPITARMGEVLYGRIAIIPAWILLISSLQNYSQ